MTTWPPIWRVDTTDEFDWDYAMLCAAGGRLPELWEGWSYYLRREPVVHSTGYFGPDDDDYRYLTGSDEHLGLEYTVGLSLDRSQLSVIVRWIEACEFEPMFD